MQSGVVALIVACVAGAIGCASSAQPAAAPGEEPGAKRPLTPAEIAARATPSIVSIRTPTGLGTGFVVREDGWIVTNLHVVAGSERVLVHLPTDKTFPVVEVMNASPPHDLVVLRIEAKELRPLPLGDIESLRPGDPIVAIGHPLGLEDTVSNGLLSAVRKIDGMVLLQVSAPIAPGSSGGPLFNEQGEVIGVATAILVGGQNLNLGLPANYVKELVDNPDPMSFSDFTRAVARLRRRVETPERKIPRHPPTVFAGCDDRSIALMAHGISDAIAVGAPLYNQGNHRACFQIYQGAASDIENRLPKACQGPKRALAQGRSRAAELKDPAAQAWAMRDTFDGLVEAITRRAHGD
ncbi:MAG TPA: trypsin-like peptidase domain-containing protein [Polyangiaceae bacterium]